MLVTRKDLLNALERRFKSETYVSEDDNLYCPMILISNLFDKAISKFPSHQAFVFKQRYTDFIENWSERVLIPIKNGESLLVQDVEMLAINPDGSVIATTVDNTKLLLDIMPKLNLSQLRLLGITEDFLSAYRGLRNELSALPDISYVLREIMPDFEANTTTGLKKKTIEYIFNEKNEEALDLLIRMSPDILDDLEIIFSKFDTCLS